MDWISACTSFQTSNVHRHTDSGLGNIPQSQHRVAYICVNVLDPLLTLQGHYYMVTITDCCTCLPEAIPMETVMSASCISALLSGWIVNLGIPEHITSDRGTTFTSQLWTSSANLLGNALHQTTAYNPAAKGEVEDFHCTLNADLMSWCKFSNWFTHLP
ncbi:uncharacterized protein [Palaemon carinicauda]|uniref:uncharacterized protein n=1 Tax=Palaemon carinicauda TaxID=392227 RepID=UPI0035B601A1